MYVAMVFCNPDGSKQYRVLFSESAYEYADKPFITQPMSPADQVTSRRFAFRIHCLSSLDQICDHHD